MFSSKEIQKKIEGAYRERLQGRLKKMRRQFTERDWNGIKTEARHLKDGAMNFGHQDLAAQVEQALEVLHRRPLTKVAFDPEAKSALEKLFQDLDRFLVKSDSN